MKYNKEGSVERYKARLVINGCAQKKGIDYQETYAPVDRLSSLRILLSLVNKFRSDIHQLHVMNTFLHEIQSEDVYMHPPEGLSIDSNIVCKLKRTLYGLKQAEWNERFDEAVKVFGYVQCQTMCMSRILLSIFPICYFCR